MRSPGEIVLASLGDTERLAGRLAELAVQGDLFCLAGDLGTGKTAFARAFLRHLGVDGEIPSPTFNLVLCYDTAKGEVWHCDLYRISEAQELQELGLEDAFEQSILLIEWPDRLGGDLPSHRFELNFRPGNGAGERRLELTGHGRAAAGVDRMMAEWR